MAIIPSILMLRTPGSTFLLRTRLTRPFSLSSSRLSGSNENVTPKCPDRSSNTKDEPSSPSTKPLEQKKAKPVLQADAELRERLEQMSGDGGTAGIEYEDGKPNTMKRSVRNNMFRLI
ncbi:hypothetical protein N7478_004550 [Penicillium angulare]|uniref:uncharacterized protein n=1 Tax=Penicillium angulare TaxID=116970 RepID=UPI0025416EED|nr:uncharacterized protein N7478_004550 [Penicillium angulare]KAJ5279178.1 hypothetical protein N7478_004550 [Penicillium angulare]